MSKSKNEPTNDNPELYSDEFKGLKIDRVIYEVPKAEFDKLIKVADILLAQATAEPEPVKEKSINPLITAHEFAEAIGVKKRVAALMVAGKHPSGFQLRTFKKHGTQTVWTHANEVDRYFEGFIQNFE